MKQNKRFWLVAVAVLLVTLMVSGLALAEGANVYNEVAGYLRLNDEYTFYRSKVDDTIVYYDENGAAITLGLYNGKATGGDFNTYAINYGYTVEADASAQDYEPFKFAYVTDEETAKVFHTTVAADTNSATFTADKAGSYTVTLTAFKHDDTDKPTGVAKAIKINIVDVVVNGITVVTGSELKGYTNFDAAATLYGPDGKSREKVYSYADEALGKDEKETKDVRFTYTTNCPIKATDGTVTGYVDPFTAPDWYFTSSNKDIMESGKKNRSRSC
jgi:hypothetical protein